MALPLKIDVLLEPELEFGNGAHGVDPRRGLAANGPVDNRGLRTIRLGLVGLPDDVEAARSWLARLKRYAPALEGNAGRFRDWPGMAAALNCDFVLAEPFVRKIEPESYNVLLKGALTGRSFDELVELF